MRIPCVTVQHGDSEAIRCFSSTEQRDSGEVKVTNGGETFFLPRIVYDWLNEVHRYQAQQVPEAKADR